MTRHMTGGRRICRTIQNGESMEKIRNKLNPLLRCLCFLLVLALMLSFLGWLYRMRNNTEKGGTEYVKAYGFLTEPDGSIDVFFVGSSEFYSAICPMRIWEQAGITSYDVCTGGQEIYLTDAFVKELVTTRQPKLVVVDGYAVVNTIQADVAVFHEFGQLFPILENHNNWKKFGPRKLLSPVKYTHREEKKGFRPKGTVDPVESPDYMAPSDERYSISPLNMHYLENIRKRCAKAGVPLLIMASPSTKNWDYAKANALQDYSLRTGVPVLDLNLLADEIDIDMACDYWDDGDHLNGDGAKKVSIFLAAYLREHYGLESHLQDSAYEQWNVDYESLYDQRPEGAPVVG